jgi:hypothetical protein
MRFRNLLAALVLLTVLAAAGAVLPASQTWRGSDSTGSWETTVESSSTGNLIVVTRKHESPEHVITKLVMTCALNSAGTAYATPTGGEIEFTEVAPSSTKAYEYEITDSAGGTIETGLITL